MPKTTSTARRSAPTRCGRASCRPCRRRCTGRRSAPASAPGTSPRCASHLRRCWSAYGATATCSRRRCISLRRCPCSVRRPADLRSRPEMDQIELRNRLLLATGMWREATGEPLPRMPPGDPADQIQRFELQLVDRLWQMATPENAREIADRTWDLVHDRPDDDPVKRRVVECHEALARMTHLGD